MCLFLKLLFHLSSLAPAMFIATFRAYSLYSIDSKRTIFCCVAFLVLFFIPFLVLKISKNFFPEETFKATNVELLYNVNTDFIGPYLWAYITPTLNWLDACVGFVLLCIVMIIIYRNTISFHPWLNIEGYRCYRITNSKNVSFILISKRLIKNADEVSCVYHITELMLVDFISEES